MRPSVGLRVCVCGVSGSLGGGGGGGGGGEREVGGPDQAWTQVSSSLVFQDDRQ